MKTIEKIEYLQSDFKISPKRKSKKDLGFALQAVKFYFNSIGLVFPKLSAKLAYRLFTTPMMRAKHRSSDNLMETARIFEIMYGKQMLKAYEWGNGDRTILLVHGWESRGTALRSFVPELLKKGFRVITFDGPAHGNSGGKRTNLPHFSGAIKAVINQVGGVYGIIAHSFGGAASTYALVNKGNPLPLEKLVLIACPARTTYMFEDAFKMMNLPNSIKKEFINIIESILETSTSAADISNSYSKVKIVDTLIVHDKEDDIVSLSGAKEIHNHWKNSSLLVTNGYGHFRLMKNPDVVNRVVGFINV